MSPSMRGTHVWHTANSDHVPSFSVRHAHYLVNLTVMLESAIVLLSRELVDTNSGHLVRSCAAFDQ
jgi:hypothetical protein